MSMQRRGHNGNVVMLVGCSCHYCSSSRRRKIDYSVENRDKQGEVEGGEEEEVTDETTGLKPKTYLC